PDPGGETTDPDNTPPDTDIVTETGTLAPDGAAVGFSFIGQSTEGTANKSTIFTNNLPDEIYIDTVDGIGNVPVAGSVNFDECNPCSFISATGTLVAGSTGGNPTIGVNWGRWSGSYVITENGIPDTTMGDFHYIYSDNVTPAAVLQNLTGVVYYYSPTGTAPTDQNGATGSLNSLSMQIDFGSQTVTDLNLSVTTPATGTISAYSLSGPLSIPLNDLTGNGVAIDATNGFDPGTSGLNGYVGEIQGTFVGPGLMQGNSTDGIITTYGFREDTNPSTNAVSGAALIVDGGV
ncbi:MAG: hypothetical protein OQK13_01035, partial [Gammaproteobacteria bacterium]|nr:hypothetical protein [Gammaproteobacteria bacterium]